ncbi:hypothetical protein PTTG_28983 [Puccinia triticina 1-1 BBBD Race 1]|uniref:Uncharacterized protein n=1 Tax=Puccinia triticina (isolate 1-1 / race 1 (BBBD)) TaxID=630390 RepID=A0A180G7S2_PUCT1|nr:hypothetical protein PTTG_28983 [Puccinia triticina 1-1 BBBD Race 1]
MLRKTCNNPPRAQKLAQEHGNIRAASGSSSLILPLSQRISDSSNSLTTRIGHLTDDPNRISSTL